MNIMNDFQKLIDFKNLYRSYKVSMKGKGKKLGAIKFNMMALENIFVMKHQLVNHEYKLSPYNEFIVSQPKKRIIKSGSFRDKVLQHCLCDYVLLPKMENEFIKDSYAGQIGKGTLFGLDRLSENFLDYYNKNGSDGYILKCDITKFFYSINHDVLKKIIRYHFDDKDIQYVCDMFIDSTNGDGLPLGNQCSQVFALMYLNGLDHLIVDELQCEYYGRYMDDFYIISRDKGFLKHCLKIIEEHLATLHLTLNSKTQIVTLKKGIRFLGFHTYITEDGKVIRKLTGDNKRQIKKRLRKYYKLVAAGKMTKEKFFESYESWRSHAAHGNCFKLICNMDNYVESLFEGYEMNRRTIIAGGRKFDDYNLLRQEVLKHIDIEKDNVTIVSGTAMGADKLGEKFADEFGLPVTRMPANWNLYGKRAGYLRNEEMALYASKSNGMLIAFWDGKSRGTMHMIQLARKHKLEVHIVYYRDKEDEIKENANKS